jgi:CBS domain-containing protein
MASRIEHLLKNVRVRDLELQSDHRIDPSTPLAEVYRVFDEQRHGAAMVCDGDNVVGIFTQRDVLYRTALEDLDPQTPISELMSSRPVTIGLNQALSEAIQAMVEGGYRHIPVVDDDGRQVGLLSSRVILRFIADQYPESVLNLPPRLHQIMPRPEGG